MSAREVAAAREGRAHSKRTVTDGMPDDETEQGDEKIRLVGTEEGFDRSLDGELADDEAEGASASHLRSKTRMDEFLKEFGLQLQGDSQGLQARDSEDEPQEVSWDEEVHGPLEGGYPGPGEDGKFHAQQIVQVLEERRAMDISVVDIDGKSSFTKQFIIATARSGTHQKNLANDLRKMYAAGKCEARVQGQESDWLIVDGHDIVVHIMSEDARKFFNLEDLWVKEITGVEGIEPAETMTTEVLRKGKQREQRRVE